MFFKRFICILITSIILLADSGQMIYAHTCLKSGSVSFSISKPGNDCCHTKAVKHSCCKKKEEAKQAIKSNRATCCSLYSKYIKQSFPTNRVEVEKNIELPVAILPLNLFEAYALTVLNNMISPSNIPPLILSEAHISFTQVIRC